MSSACSRDLFSRPHRGSKAVCAASPCPGTYRYVTTKSHMQRFSGGQTNSILSIPQSLLRFPLLFIGLVVQGVVAPATSLRVSIPASIRDPPFIIFIWFCNIRYQIDISRDPYRTCRFPDIKCYKPTKNRA